MDLQYGKHFSVSFFAFFVISFQTDCCKTEISNFENLPVSFIRNERNVVVTHVTVNDTNFKSTTESLDAAIRRQEEVEENEFNENLALSRKRRYLIFPEGSSLQVVFCLTYLSQAMIYDVFYLGATASLAWELPQDPYSPFEHHAEALHRDDKGNLVYKDAKGSQKMQGWGNRILVNKLTGEPIQPFAKDYYKKKNLKKGYQSLSYLSDKKSQGSPRKRVFVNPVFAKRSADGVRNKTNEGKKNKSNKGKKRRASVFPVDRDAMHEEQNDRKHLDPEYMNHENVEFHRLSRRGLYEKIEKLIVGMGYHGRECVLKTLCEMGQDKNGAQGTFIEEIMRVIFTLPKGNQFEDFHHQGYDEAHEMKQNCEEKYSECPFSIKSLPLVK